MDDTFDTSEPRYLLTAHEGGGIRVVLAEVDHPELFSLDQITALIEERLPEGFVLLLGGAQ